MQDLSVSKLKRMEEVSSYFEKSTEIPLMIFSLEIIKTGVFLSQSLTSEHKLQNTFLLQLIFYFI